MRNNVSIEASALAMQMHSSGISYELAMGIFEQAFLRVVLRDHKFNQCAAADAMGMHRNTIARKLAKDRYRVAWTLKTGPLNPPVPVSDETQELIEQNLAPGIEPKSERDVFWEVKTA